MKILIDMFKIDYKLYKIAKSFSPDILMEIHNFDDQ